MAKQSAKQPPLGLVVVGAAGRMGRTLIRIIHETPGVTLAAAVERKGAAEIGRDAGDLVGIGASGVTVTDEIESYDYGKFVHIMDPEGNKIELWEPVDEEYDKIKGEVTK